jgi:hypothetical protein
MPHPDTISNLANKLSNRYSELEIRTLNRIGKRIKDIGEVLPSDATQLARLRDIGGDIVWFKTYIAHITGLSMQEVDALFAAAAADNMDFARGFYDEKGKTYVPYAENKPLQRTVAAQSTVTNGTLQNLSQTTVCNIGTADKQNFVPFDVAYQKIVDDAITAVQSGVRDYNSVMREILRPFAGSGLQTVEYGSGHTRRLDSAFRQNLLDGVRAVNQAVADQIGNEIGADGYEISAHMTCATDHLPVQGRRFSKAEFAKLQTGLPFSDEKGRTYRAIKRPIGKWNCRHTATPVLLGLSHSQYTDEQLKELQEANEKKIKVGGKDYTAYELSQLMRQIETEIRKAKNEVVICEAMGDTVGANAARRKVRDYTAMYENVSRASKQRKKYARTYVAGYR